MCSSTWATPEVPSTSSMAPTRYHTMCTADGARRSPLRPRTAAKARPATGVRGSFRVMPVCLGKPLEVQQVGYPQLVKEPRLVRGHGGGLQAQPQGDLLHAQ